MDLLSGSSGCAAGALRASGGVAGESHAVMRGLEVRSGMQRGISWAFKLVLGLFLVVFSLGNEAVGQTLDYGDRNIFPSASSTANSALRIGATVDAESSATTNSTATGDNITGTDDEDGVTLPASVVVGSSGSIVVNVTNTRGATAYLNVWIDWNNNGTLTDSGEQVATNTTIANGTSNSNRTITFTVPSSATPGNVGVRVRLTSVSSPGPDGTDGIGEVEDHMLTVVPAFSFVVVNYSNNTISRFNGGDGAMLLNSGLTGLSSPNYLYRLSDNTFLVANGSSNSVTKYNGATGEFLGTLVSGLSFPYQMAVAPDGNIYIANQNGSTVSRFNQTTGASGGVVISNISSPSGVGFDSAGQLYVTQNISGGSLRRYNTSGVLQATISTWPSGEYPRGLAWGPDGRLYVNVRVNSGSTGRVDAISFPSNTRTTFVNMDAGSNPYTGIKWGPDGNLYVVDFDESEVHVYTPEGALLRTVTSTLSGPHAVAFTDISPSSLDFGDYAGFASASSTWSSSIRLGLESDTETASRANDYANGDDIDDIDDEDGVTLPAVLYAGSTGSVTIKRLNTSGSTVYLNGWIDFNNNGVLTDSGEQIIANQTVSNGTNGTNQTYTFNVPAAAVAGNVGARFRITSTSNPGPTGNSGNGEVEDYVVEVMGGNTDFGDYSSFPSASSTVNSLLRIGDLVDGEAVATTNATATGDDITGSDDEDGVTVPASLAQGASSSLTVNVTNTTGAAAYLNAWVDFNRNGVLTDAGEQIASNIVVATGSSNSNRTLSFTVPSNASQGTAGVRVRLTSVASPGSDGLDGSGEVEDYVTTISCAGVEVATQTLDAGTVGTPYSFTLSATGGVGPYTWSLVSGSLPAGLSLSSAGVVSGTPSAVTTGASGASFVLKAANSAGCQTSLTFTLRICPVILLSPTTLPNGAMTQAYSQTITSSNGAAPHVYAVSSGSLPAGLSLNPSTGVISGTPTSSAAQTFTLSSTDANGCMGSRSYTVTPAQSHDFGDHSALGSASSTVNSSLMMGESVDAEATATTNATATGDDTTGIDDEDGVTMPASLQPGTTVTVPVTVVNKTGSPAYLHAWIDFNNDGVMNNATIANGGERLETVRTIPAATTGLILRQYWTGLNNGVLVSDLTNNANYPNNPTGYDHRANFTAPVDWADNMGQRMRGWVYPPVTGGYTFWVSGDDETKLYLGTNETAASAVQIATVPGWSGSLEWTKYAEQKSVTINLEAGRAYYIEGIMKEAGGGDSLAAAWQLPNTSTGPVIIDGQYLAPWTDNQVFSGVQEVTFTVPMTAVPGTNRAVRFRLTDSATTTATGASGMGEVEDYAVTINAPPADYGDFNLFPSAGSEVSTALRIGALVDSDALPEPDAMATNDDVTGVDDEDGVTVPVTLTRGAASSITVNVTNTSGAVGYLNAWVDFNGNGTLTDAGEQIATNTAIATGTSNSNRTLSFTVPGTAVLGKIGVRVRLTSVVSPGPDGLDGIGEVEDYITTVACAAATVGPATLAGGTVGTAYNQTLAANGGTGPYGSWSITSGTLPAGLALNASTGVISGTPTTANGSGVSVTVRALDSFGCPATGTVAIKICPVITLTPTSLPASSAGATYSATVTASGSASAYVYTVSSGSLPSGLSLNASTGVISGTVMSSTAQTFTVTATDASGCAGSRAYTLHADLCCDQHRSWDVGSGYGGHGLFADAGFHRWCGTLQLSAFQRHTACGARPRLGRCDQWDAHGGGECHSDAERERFHRLRNECDTHDHRFRRGGELP